MSQFRTRRIKTKYLKIKKKNLQLLQNQQLSLKKKNWKVFSDQSDVGFEAAATPYKNLYTSEFLTAQSAKSYFIPNSYLYYDSTIKFLITLPKINRLFFTQININMFKKQNIKNSLLPEGFVFYFLNITFFYKKVNDILKQFGQNCFITFSLLSQKCFLHSTQLLAQTGFFAVVSFYDNSDLNMKQFDFSLFSDILIFLHESALLEIEELSKFVFIGFFYSNMFYSFFNLYYKLFFLEFLIGDSKNSKRLDVVKNQLLTSFNNIYEISKRRDNDLFFESPNPDVANLIQSLEQQKAVSSDSFVVTKQLELMIKSNNSFNLQQSNLRSFCTHPLYALFFQQFCPHFFNALDFTNNFFEFFFV